MALKGVFFYPLSPYIMTTTQTVFEVKLLEQVTHQIVHAGVTFESQALSSFGSDDERRLASFKSAFSRMKNKSSSSWKLNEKRIKDPWFLYNLL